MIGSIFLSSSITNDIRVEILMHLRALKKVKKDVSLHDPIGTDKEGNEITVGDYLYFKFNKKAHEINHELSLDTAPAESHHPAGVFLFYKLIYPGLFLAVHFFVLHHLFFRTYLTHIVNLE